MIAWINVQTTVTRTIIDRDMDGTTGMITTTAITTTGIMDRGTTHGDHLRVGTTGGIGTQRSQRLV
jgi:hypothetical protein